MRHHRCRLLDCCLLDARKLTQTHLLLLVQRRPLAALQVMDVVLKALVAVVQLTSPLLTAVKLLLGSLQCHDKHRAVLSSA